MDRSKLSLKWLEVFQAVAQNGSVQGAAKELGVSVSTASHHLSCLERAVGAPLLDHSRRPMRLTAGGEALVRRVDEAMWLLKMGVSEIWSDNLQSLARVLRIAQIEDFDADVCPQLVEQLMRVMPACEFSILSRPSHEIFELLQSEQVDVGVATSADHAFDDLHEEAILTDPYLLVTPLNHEAAHGDQLATLAKQREFPLLRYRKDQLIGRRVEAQLRRLSLFVPAQIELESTRAILSMVAHGHGWTITTALNFTQAQRYHDQLRLEPFPGKSFSRQISLFKRDDLPARVYDFIAASLRRSVQKSVVEPLVERHPWLQGRVEVLSRPPIAR